MAGTICLIYHGGKLFCSGNMSATKLFPDAKVVRIDIEAHEIDRNRSSEVGLVGDCGYVLNQLLPMVGKRDHSHTTFCGSITYKVDGSLHD